MADNKTTYPPSVYENPSVNKYTNIPYSPMETQKKVTDTRFYETLSQYCPHCNLTFVDNTEYEHHNMEMHGGRKILSCDQCHAIFGRQDHLKRHVKSLHHNQKYCHCPVCGMDCKRQDHLLNHIKSKHSEKPEIYHCRECNYECGSLMDLESHETTHLSIERHLCPHCKTSFKRRDHMLRHIKSQHLNQSVVCPICDQTFKRKDHVVRHVREKHKMVFLNGKLIKSSDILLD